MAERPGTARPRGEPRRGDRLTLEPSDIDDRERAAGDIGHRTLAPRWIDERSERPVDAGVLRQRTCGLARAGAEAACDDAFRFDT